MFKMTSADGTEIHAFDEGRGPLVLVLHAGLDDGSQWGKVARRLSERFRVVRLHRRQYRLDLPGPCTMAQEAEDAVAVAKALREPCVLVGHSSGAVAALEAMLLAKADGPARSPFAGAVLYEPPVALGPTLGGDATLRARAAIDAGRPGRAMKIFLRDVVRLPPAQAALAGLAIASIPKIRARTARQIDDLAAIDALGNRLDAYAGIDVPTVLLGGDESPANLGERLDALQSRLPRVERVVMRGQGHGAHLRGADEVGRVIAAHADKVLGTRERA